MLKRLRLKFVCINMAIVTAILCVIFAAAMQFTRENLQQESIYTLQNISMDPFRTAQIDAADRDIRLPYFVVQISPFGEIVITSGGYYDLTDTASVLELIETALLSDSETGVLEAQNLRFYKNTLSSGLCIVFADISSEVRTLTSLRNHYLVIGAGSFAVFLLLSFLLAGWAVRPVQKSWDQQRQFVSDASHELKTPLTVITTNAELLQTDTCSAEAKAQFADNILTSSRQMRGLVEGLLELARVDNGAVQKAFAEFDFSAAVASAQLPFEPLYFEQGLTLDADIAPDITVYGSEQHLRQVIDILLDNAGKYCLPGGNIRVSLTQSGRNCLLAVSNPAHDISAEELKRIFDRFYRMDASRSMQQGYGLGLAIAAGIVAEHKGKIWAESRGGEATFYVQLPAESTY